MAASRNVLMLPQGSKHAELPTTLTKVTRHSVHEFELTSLGQHVLLLALFRKRLKICSLNLNCRSAPDGCTARTRACGAASLSLREPFLIIFCGGVADVLYSFLALIV